MEYHLPEIGSWGEEKYRLVRNYCQIFATSMKDKWQCRVYTRRNVSIYMRPENRKTDEFIGRSNWRHEWPQAEMRGENFGLFFIKQFCTSMAEIGYKYTTAKDSVEIRSTEKNLPLYRLAFFSKHQLAHKFWEDVKKYSKSQMDLF